MSRTLRRLLPYTLAFACVLAPRAAFAACSSSLPYTFTPASYVTSTTTNANNNFLLACARSVDNSQIGTLGIFASQIKPTNGGQATFGGSQAYTFPAGISATSGAFSGNVTSAGNVGATGFVQGSYISSAYSNNQGLFYGGGGNTSQLDYNITNANRWTFTAPLTVNGALASSGNITSGGSVGATGFVQGSYISSAYSNNQGLFYGGGGNTSQLDYNITNTNRWTFTSPLTVNGTLKAATGSISSQVLPFLYAGGPVSGQAHAHIEVNVATTGSGGSVNVGFADTFDTVPYCQGQYGSGNPVPNLVPSGPTGFTVTGGLASTAFTWFCIGQ